MTNDEWRILVLITYYNKKWPITSYLVTELNMDGKIYFYSVMDEGIKSNIIIFADDTSPFSEDSQGPEYLGTPFKSWFGANFSVGVPIGNGPSKQAVHVHYIIYFSGIENCQSTQALRLNT